jgi:hypothetical protein
MTPDRYLEIANAARRLRPAAVYYAALRRGVRPKKWM